MADSVPSSIVCSSIEDGSVTTQTYDIWEPFPVLSVVVLKDFVPDVGQICLTDGSHTFLFEKTDSTNPLLVSLMIFRSVRHL